jgi:hypothetical protein
MDDRHAHFLTVVVDICLGAALGRLTIEIETVGGACISGTPTADTDDGGREIDSQSTVHVGAHELRLGDIAACRVHAPAIPGSDSPPPLRSAQTQRPGRRANG